MSQAQSGPPIGFVRIDFDRYGTSHRLMTRVLIHSSAPQRHIAKLTEAYPELQIEGVSKNSALRDSLARFAPDVLFTVNITSDAPFPRNEILNSNLKWVSVAGSGTDHLTPWDPQAITVTNSAGVAAEMMAEYAIGCFLHFSLGVPAWMKDQAEKAWNPAREVRSIAGKTLLVVGLGHTGRALAKSAKNFGMNVIGTRANPRGTSHCDEVHGSGSLPQLWPRADFVAICTPRLPSTENLVDQTAFQLMKDSAILVNVARGGVVNEADLITALEAGQIAGAAMDVFAAEPLPADDPIWNAPNLLISPHCSAVYDGWEAASLALFSENLGRFLHSEPLTNIVDPNRGY